MWEYIQPVRVWCGAGVLHEKIAGAVSDIKGRRGLLVTSPSFTRRGDAASVIGLIESGGTDVRIVAVYDKVSPNPDISQCVEAVALAREHKCDFIVAMGGGSVMDCAKVVGAYAGIDKDVSRCLDPDEVLPHAGLPLIAVPTTAGTGSEVTAVAVISDHRRGLKLPLVSPAFYPVVALVDPLLTLSAPAKLTACTGFDALCHAVEAFWSRHHRPVCDAIAIEAIRLILDNLLTACRKPDDVAARTALADASVMAGMAFAMPKTSAPHACSYPLTNTFGIAHGAACALTLTAFMRFNYSHGCRRLERLASSLGYNSVDALADAIDTLMDATGLPRNLRAYGVTPDRLDELAHACMHPNMRNNPVDVAEADVRLILAGLMA